MRIESKLCHLSENRAVVQVNGWLNDKNLGSALAEGATVEIAEDKAILRLNKRINLLKNKDVSQKSIDEDKKTIPLNVELPKTIKKDNNSINNEPSDWSNELTAIDLEIARLKWTRDEEIKFLEQTFGYNSRSKITNYSDILNYLRLLKNIDKDTQSEVLNDNIKKLMEESDNLLRDLSWDNVKGREYLQKHFNVSMRKELKEKQLILFVENLKSIRKKYFDQETFSKRQAK